jgi:hypothetical protein
MLGNIPAWYTQDLLLEEVSQVLCTSSTFDFFYLPWDSQKDQGIRQRQKKIYAFINFVSSAEAERCKLLFANHVFKGGQGRKPCRVCYAHVQGLMNNVRHLMDRAAAEAQIHYPIIVWEGQRLKLGQVMRLRSHAVSNSILSSDSLAHAPWADHVMRKANAEAQSEDGSSDLLQDSTSSNSSVTWDSSCGVPPPLKLLSSDFVASVSTTLQDWSATSGSSSSGSQHQSNAYSHSPHRPPKVLNCADDDVSLEHQGVTNVHRRRQHFADSAYPCSFAIPPADSRVFRSLASMPPGLKEQILSDNIEALSDNIEALKDVVATNLMAKAHGKLMEIIAAQHDMLQRQGPANVVPTPAAPTPAAAKDKKKLHPKVVTHIAETGKTFEKDLKNMFATEKKVNKADDDIKAFTKGEYPKVTTPQPMQTQAPECPSRVPFQWDR